jgi:hypothetical protein
MKHLLSLLILLLLLNKNSYSQTNGYSLEFESTILLSLDTVPIPPINTVRIKQFTVPAGTVLKINSGFLRNICVVTNPITYQQKATLSIGNKNISPITSSGAGDWFLISFTTENAIWANAGETVTLKFENTSYSPSTLNSISFCWVGGVLFRKIAN